MSRRSTKSELDGPPNEVGSDIQKFLVSELPPGDTGSASYFVDAVSEAGERYDRYSTRKGEWSDYAARKGRLEKIVTLTEGLASALSDLDVLSRDDLTGRVGSKDVDAMIGSSRRLSKEAAILVSHAQTFGRGRDLAEERWIIELADIYENAFHQPACVWKTGRGPRTKRRGFYQFLELSLPKTFPRHGKLHPRQVDRLLERRRRVRGAS
jgi:hypothetical protein